ncbi:MAG: hypothetical protein HY289_14865 [Planctomycetes bacterium]|nr:hypothetical protein [Planctomycetota bacterium]
MPDLSLNNVLEAAQKLTPDEQRQLRARLEERPTQPDESDQMRAFHQALLASGLVTTIKPQRPDRAGQRRLIAVEGKPISETIIEERR